ncbi:MAG: hypothetical protein AAGK78_07690, partial [Planctomycetota bacterium]
MVRVIVLKVTHQDVIRPVLKDGMGRSQLSGSQHAVRHEPQRLALIIVARLADLRLTIAVENQQRQVDRRRARHVR